MNRVLSILALVLLFSVPAAGADEPPTPEGVLGLTPVGEQSCFVVKIPLEPNQKLTALRWFHNDELTDFPVLSLMDVASPEELTNQTPLVTWTDVGGVSGSLGPGPTRGASGEQYRAASGRFPASSQQGEAGRGEERRSSSWLLGAGGRIARLVWSSGG